MHVSLKAWSKTDLSHFLLVTVFLIAVANSAAFGQEKKYPYFNRDLTLAANAAMNDARRAGLRWEALNGKNKKAAQEEFIAALHTAIKAAMREPNTYVPIAPCFELAYKNAELEKTIRSSAPSVSTIDINPTNHSEKIARLGFFLAQRDTQEGYCAAFSSQ